MDIVALSRLQFAVTTTYHFLFVPVTLGLSIFVALLETGYVFTGREQCKQLAKFFGTVFLVNFGMGVVTGIVQEFHFGMNWSEYSRFMGDIFGAPLALEALSAFFLESTFFGLWVFGWNRLPAVLHCLCIWIVAFASNLSAFWILVANSFMQHPVGYAINNGRAEMTDFLTLITNRYALGEYPHALFAGIATAGVVAMVICAYKLLTDVKSRGVFTGCMKFCVIYMLAGLLGAMGSGHMHAQYLAEAQPMKLSSVEALWETEDPAPFAAFAVINEEQKRNDFEVTIPALFSFMLYNEPSGEVKGINELQEIAVEKYGPGNYIPNVTGLFWSFRIMIASGGLLILVAFVTGWLLFKGKILDYPIWLKLLPLALPLPFIANSVGWYIAEGGRQPWIVVGLQKTAEAVSPNLTVGEISLSLLGFTVIYLSLAAASLYVVCRHVKHTSITEGSGH